MKLEISSLEAQMGRGQGPHLQAMLRIYNQSRQMVLDGIRDTVRAGDRMAAIHIEASPFPELGRQWDKPNTAVAAVVVPARSEGVEIRFTPDPPPRTSRYIVPRIDLYV